MRKRAQKAEGKTTALKDENEELKRQLSEIRRDFGYEDEQEQPKQEAPQQPQQAQIPDDVFSDHYSRAAKLKVKDYEETERKLRDAIGDQLVDGIIAESEGKSEMVTYHLGEKSQSTRSI